MRLNITGTQMIKSDWKQRLGIFVLGWIMGIIGVGFQIPWFFDHSRPAIERTTEHWSSSGSTTSVEANVSGNGECSFIDLETGKPIAMWKARSDGNCYTQDLR